MSDSPIPAPNEISTHHPDAVHYEWYPGMKWPPISPQSLKEYFEEGKYLLIFPRADGSCRVKVKTLDPPISADFLKKCQEDMASHGREVEDTRPEWMRRASEKARQFVQRRLAGESAASILREFAEAEEKACIP